MSVERLEPDQWADRWWAEFDRARRRPTPGFGEVGGELAARQAWDRMLELYGDPPPEGQVAVPARPYPGERPAECPAADVVAVAEQVLDVKLDPWQVEVIEGFYGLEPAPPSRRGWLRRAMDRMFG